MEGIDVADHGVMLSLNTLSLHQFVTQVSRTGGTVFNSCRWLN